MSKIICTMILAILSISARVQQKSSQAGPPPTPPEVKQTVDALAGTWVGQMTATVPGYPPATFAWTMECKTVALGAGVACTNGGTASIGQMSESCLFAFDPDGKAVHYMCVTSMGEVHDHKGHWKEGRVIEFEPLRAGMMGGQVTETLKWQFKDVNNLDKFSTVTMPDGSAMVFEFKGKRG
jgi:uncharacterized protein DUF1579